MYEFKQPPRTASKPQADTSDAGDQQQPQPVVQQVDGQAVVVLKFCRCADCRKYDTCPVGSDQPDHWLYCAMYRGPLLNDEYVTVPHAPRGAGNTSPSVVRGHAAAVDQPADVGHTTPPVGPRANDVAEVEHVAKARARTQRGPTGRVPTPTAGVCQSGREVGLWADSDGSFPAEKTPVGTASSQPLPFCLSSRRT